MFWLIIDDFDLIIELETFVKTIKEVITVIDFFLPFLTWYDERRVHNMIALKLDPRFKSLKLNFSFIKVLAIIKKRDRKSLFPMLLKSYYHLHPFSKVESSIAYKIDEVPYILEMVFDTNELTKELVDIP